MKYNPTPTIDAKAVRWHQKASFWQIALWCMLGLATSAQASHIPRKVAAGPNDKVLICHNGHNLYISVNAVQAHLSQHPGDKLGSCNNPGPDTPGTQGRTATVRR